MKAKIRKGLLQDGTEVSGTYGELEQRFNICRTEIRRRIAEGKPLDVVLNRGVKKGQKPTSPPLKRTGKPGLGAWVRWNTPFTWSEWAVIDREAYKTRNKWLGSKVQRD